MTSTRTLALLALFSLALAGGCHRRSTVRAIDVSAGGAQPLTISHRHYRNLLRVAGRDMGCHHSQLVPQEVSPGIFSVQGCGLLRDYVMICRGRHRCRWIGVQPVEQVAMAETGCTAGPVQLTVTGPVTRQVQACGQVLDYALACAPGVCGWARGIMAQTMVMQTEPGTTVIVVADEAGPVPAEPEPAASPEESEVVDLGAAGTLQSVLMTQLAAMHACTGGQAVTLTLRWAADGTVSVGLAPPHAGTPIEACIQGVVGQVRVQASGQPGEVQATL